MRRYTHLSNGFSRKLRNHAAATALNYFAYNFIQIHRTLSMSPAMAAGVTDRLWEVSPRGPLGVLRAESGKDRLTWKRKRFNVIASSKFPRSVVFSRKPPAKELGVFVLLGL